MSDHAEKDDPTATPTAANPPTIRTSARVAALRVAVASTADAASADATTSGTNLANPASQSSNGPHVDVPNPSIPGSDPAPPTAQPTTAPATGTTTLPAIADPRAPTAAPSAEDVRLSELHEENVSLRALISTTQQQHAAQQDQLTQQQRLATQLMDMLQRPQPRTTATKMPPRPMDFTTSSRINPRKTLAAVWEAKITKALVRFGWTGDDGEALPGIPPGVLITEVFTMFDDNSKLWLEDTYDGSPESLEHGLTVAGVCAYVRRTRPVVQESVEGALAKVFSRSALPRADTELDHRIAELNREVSHLHGFRSLAACEHVQPALASQLVQRIHVYLLQIGLPVRVRDCFVTTQAARMADVTTVTAFAAACEEYHTTWLAVCLSSESTKDPAQVNTIGTVDTSVARLTAAERTVATMKIEITALKAKLKNTKAQPKVRFNVDDEFKWKEGMGPCKHQASRGCDGRHLHRNCTALEPSGDE